MKRITALTTAAALVAAPALVLVAAPARADVERRGSCGGGSYELSVDREGRGWEVNVDLDDVAPRSTWRVVIRQDGKVVTRVTRTAERDGDLDVERYYSDTAGKDTIRFTVRRVGGAASCGAKVTV